MGSRKGVRPILGAREKAIHKDSPRPYREPAQVGFLRRERRVGRTLPREIGKLAPYVR